MRSFIAIVTIFYRSANIQINKVRKQKEIDLAGLEAALKKAQSRISSLEMEVQQKVSWIFPQIAAVVLRLILQLPLLNLVSLNFLDERKC